MYGMYWPRGGRLIDIVCTPVHLYAATFWFQTPDSRQQLKGLRPPLKTVYIGLYYRLYRRRTAAGRATCTDTAARSCHALGCSTGCRVSQGQSPQSLCRYLCRYCAGTALVLF
jgi:hypothetical protein